VKPSRIVSAISANFSELVGYSRPRGKDERDGEQHGRCCARAGPHRRAAERHQHDANCRKRYRSPRPAECLPQSAEAARELAPRRRDEDGVRGEIEDVEKRRELIGGAEEDMPSCARMRWIAAMGMIVRLRITA
jgi:hypothetical protein